MGNVCEFIVTRVSAVGIGIFNSFKLTNDSQICVWVRASRIFIIHECSIWCFVGCNTSESSTLRLVFEGCNCKERLNRGHFEVLGFVFSKWWCFCRRSLQIFLSFYNGFSTSRVVTNGFYNQATVLEAEVCVSCRRQDLVVLTLFSCYW